MLNIEECVNNLILNNKKIKYKNEDKIKIYLDEIIRNNLKSNKELEKVMIKMRKKLKFVPSKSVIN